MAYVGQPLERIDDRRLVVSKGRFVATVRSSEMNYESLRSSSAHSRLSWALREIIGDRPLQFPKLNRG